MEAIIELNLGRLDGEDVRARANAVRRNGEAFNRQIDAERAAERGARAAAAQTTLRRRRALDALERELD